MSTAEVIPYTRPQLSPLDMANVERKIKQCPVMLRSQFAVKVQIENAALVKRIIELRNQRNMTPLKADADWNSSWDEIDSACTANNSDLALRLVLRENMRLTAEIKEHQKATGAPLMKSYKAG